MDFNYLQIKESTLFTIVGSFEPVVNGSKGSWDSQTRIKRGHPYYELMNHEGNSTGAVARAITTATIAAVEAQSPNGASTTMPVSRWYVVSVDEHPSGNDTFIKGQYAVVLYAVDGKNNPIQYNGGNKALVGAPCPPFCDDISAG